MAGRRSLFRQKGRAAGPPQSDPDPVRQANSPIDEESDPLQAEYADHLGTTARLAAVSPTTEMLGDCFASVVERYQSPLIGFLYGMVGNREQAEDLAQDTFIKAYEAMQHRSGSQPFSVGWLFRIARNTAIDSLRRKRLIAWLPFGVEHEQVLPERGDFAGVLAEQELVQQVLARLPARYRECLLLRTTVGMSNGEIAGTLGISVRNVNTSLFRARERFRRVYAQLECVASGTAVTVHSGEEEECE